MKNGLKATAIIAGIAACIWLLIFSPAITFCFAWFGGLVLKLCVGNVIADGLNLMFNTTRFTPDLIPMACATLATIGKYFMSTQINYNGRR